MIKTSYLKTMGEKDILFNMGAWLWNWKNCYVSTTEYKKKNPDELKSTKNIKLKK